MVHMKSYDRTWQEAIVAYFTQLSHLLSTKAKKQTTKNFSQGNWSLGAAEWYIMRSFLTCTRHQILLGWSSQRG